MAELIATKVMGWHRGTCERLHIRPEHHCQFTWHWYAEDGAEGPYAEPSDDYYNPQESWSPDIDIGDAWQVVEYLAQMDPPRWLEIGQREHGWSVNVWVHCQAHGDRCEALDRPVWLDNQETAPLAICRAALRAVGVVPESV